MTATLSPALSPVLSGQPADPFAAARTLIRASAWHEGLEAADVALAGGHAPDAQSQLLIALAQLRAAAAAAETITPELIRAADGRRDVRMLAISPVQTPENA